MSQVAAKYWEDPETGVLCPFKNLMPLGVPFPVMDHLPGVVVDNSQGNFIMLTAGQDGPGGFNEGKLTSETITGEAPLLEATAEIADSTSPLFGQTVNLINTERRFVRAGEAGIVQDDAFQGHGHNIMSALESEEGTGLNNSRDGGNSTYRAFFSSGSGSYGPSIRIASPMEWGEGIPRADSETRPRNISVTYYMRIK